jgi:hypothetical protein
MRIQNFRISLAAGILSVSVAYQSAFADGYPYSGYFAQRTETTPREMLQAACSLMFFKQNLDGTSITYVLNEEEFKKNGTVSYVIINKSNCRYAAKTGIDSCLSENFDQGSSYSGIFFFYYDRLPGDDVTGFMFSNINDTYAFLRSRDKTLPSDDYSSATKYNIHRCEGFSDETMSKHLTQQSNTLPADATDGLYERPIDKQVIPMVLDVMQKIGKKAFNATLPGQ